MTTSQNKSEKEQVMDFIRLCLRHWYYFVISGIICLALGILYYKMATPVYKVIAQVALRQDESLGGSVGKSSSGILSAIGLGGGKENIEDETLKMHSQGNIKEVVKALDLNKIYTFKQFFGLLKKDLYDQSPVVLSADPSLADSITGGVLMNLKVKNDGSATVKMEYGEKKFNYTLASFPATLNTEAGDFTLSASPLYANYKKPFSLEIAFINNDVIAQVYRDIIGVDFYKKNSNLIDLSSNSENVALAKKLLQTTIECYNKNWDKDKEYVYSQTTNYINQRLELAQQDLLEADRHIQEFKDRYNLTDIEADVTYYFKMDGEVQGLLLQTETQLKLVDIILGFVQDDNNRYSLVPYNLTTSDASMTEMITKYNEEILRRNELGQTHSQSLLAQSLDNQLDSQRKNLLLSLSNVKKGLQTTMEMLWKKEQEVNKKIGNIPSVERDYISLKRAQELQQTVYIFLLEKREETSVRAVSLMPKLKMIDEPYVLNKLVAPNLKKILMMVFFGGIVIPLSLIYGAPFLRRLRKAKTL